MERSQVRYTQAARYVDMLKRVVPSERWDDMRADVQAISDMLRSNKEYVRWASCAPQRWDHIVNLSDHPELVKLLKLLVKRSSITFIIDIADEMAEKYRHVIVEYAGERPSQEDKIRDMIRSVWGQEASLIYEKDDNLIEGVRLKHKGKAFDMSFRHYRQNLIAKLRQS